MNQISCIMTKTRVLSISVICLVVINVGLILAILIGGPKHFKEPRLFIIETLHFDSNQVLEFEKLITAHKNELFKKSDKIKTLKDKLYLTLINNDTIREAETLEEIMRLKKNIEILHLSHFKDIKSICKPDQQEKFAKLIRELPQLFSDPRERQKP